MPRIEPPSAVDDFLRRHGMNPSAGVSNVVQQAPQPQPQPTIINSEYTSASNFLPPDQRRTWTVPAGETAMNPQGNDPLEGRRHTPEMQRAEYQAAQRQIAAATQLSGSHSIRVSPRIAAQEGWEHHMTRRTGSVLSTEWTRAAPRMADPIVPRDPAGRPASQTGIDSGFVPGSDFV